MKSLFVICSYFKTFGQIIKLSKAKSELIVAFPKKTFYNGLRVLFQVISIYGQPENCTNACKEILKVMQQEATSTNRAGYNSQDPYPPNEGPPPRAGDMMQK